MQATGTYQHSISQLQGDRPKIEGAAVSVAHILHGQDMGPLSEGLLQECSNTVAYLGDTARTKTQLNTEHNEGGRRS
jgi:hypothetical protein